MQRTLSRPAGCTRPAASSRRLLAPESLRFAALAAAHPHPVLLTGETGCGKTHLARIIHEAGPRADGPFVRVNCAAIPEALFERELFGHVRGAFTGAQDGAAGVLEAAHGGTLFLDEIGELPLALQPKLLTVLEEGAFRRLGSTRETPVDVKVIVATNRDLAAMVAQGTFREDLYFRCSAFQHRVPPLRDRLDRLEELVDELLARNAPPDGPPARVDDVAVQRLRSHAWPGNLRELENVLRYAVVVAGGGPVQPQHLPEPLCRCPCPARAATAEPAPRYRAPGDEAEELEMIRQALRLEGGNRTRAARRLGMSRSALWMKLRIYAGVLDGDAAEDGAEAAPGVLRLQPAIAGPGCPNTFGHRRNTPSAGVRWRAETAMAGD